MLKGERDTILYISCIRVSKMPTCQGLFDSIAKNDIAARSCC